MKVERFVTKSMVFILGVVALGSLWPSRVLARGEQSQTAAAQSALAKIVREVTAPYKDVAAAETAGYFLKFGCVTGEDSGAMGLHYVNFPLVLDGEIDARRPEIVLYEPTADGRVSLVGADYLVLAADWDPTHSNAPELNGQLFHFFDAPNRFGLPPFYTLHVWAWKENPTGTFVNWHSNISCDTFAGQNR